MPLPPLELTVTLMPPDLVSTSRITTDPPMPVHRFGWVATANGELLASQDDLMPVPPDGRPGFDSVVSALGWLSRFRVRLASLTVVVPDETHAHMLRALGGDWPGGLDDIGRQVGVVPTVRVEPPRAGA